MFTLSARSRAASTAPDAYFSDPRRCADTLTAMATVVGERRIVSVLMADVAGSTAIGERLGPERSKFLLDEIVRMIATTVCDFGGTVAQIAGDGVLALFGAPLSHEDDAERAVRAAIALQGAIARQAREVSEAYDVDLVVRVGVNTGPVVVSENGDDDAERYNALGDTVNVAARLQAVAGGGGVVLGPETARQVESCFELEPLGGIDLRGREAPVSAWRVLGERSAVTDPQEPPLIGREFELAVMRSSLDGVAEGRGAILVVTGEPGIGKSRLVRELTRLDADRLRWVRGRALSYAGTFAYWPLRDLVREWLGAGSGTPDARLRLELKTRLHALLGRESAEEAYPFIGAMTGVSLEADDLARMRDLSREGMRHRTIGAVSEIVRALAEEAPLAVVLEDLHWADDATLDLLEELLPLTEECPVALVLLYRTERSHRSWRLGELARQRHPHRYREVELRALPADASRMLAAERAGASLPEAVSELLAERSGGNPFFLEEALRDLVERGALVRANGHFELAGDDELVVPALVQGALQARIDRLDPVSRRVLQVASVVGRVFAQPLLQQLVPPDELQTALTELQRVDLVSERRRRPVAEYRFRHGLVQEVAYGSLLEGARRDLHRRVGEALEELHVGRPGDVCELLAHHFTEADDAERAARYLLIAGDAARALYADQEAVAHYRRAQRFLRRLGDEGRERETLFRIALAHHLAFDFARAGDALDEAFCCRIPERAEPALDERLEFPVTASLRNFAPGGPFSSETALMTGLLYRGLLEVDETGNVVPCLAETWRVSEDGLQYLFRMRADAAWSDGRPITAGDVAYGWEQLRAEGAQAAVLLSDVVRIAAHDERTLEVRVREPRSYFPYLLASVWTVPWPRHRCEADPEGWRNPDGLVVCGPFMLESVTDEGVHLVANPYYRGRQGNVGDLHIVQAASDVAHEGWKAGRFDIMQTWREPDPDDESRTAVMPEALTQLLGFNASRPPFSNVLVRRAFAYALDRKRIARDIDEIILPATNGGVIPPALPGHTHGASLAHNPDEARRLLAEAGYPEGRGFPEVVLAMPYWHVRLELAQQWRDVLGVNVRVDVLRGHKPLMPDQLDYDMWTSGWSADYPDPDGMLRGLVEGSGWPFQRDEEVLDLVRRARSTHDQDERMRLYHEFDRLWVGDRAAVVPLWYGRALYLYRPWVCALPPVHCDVLQLDRVEVRR